MVELAVLPFEAKHLVVVGTSLRKPRVILDPYLQSLAWQVVPRGVEFAYFFIDDGLEDDAKALVEEWLSTRKGQLIPSGQGGAPDFSDVGVTHGWSETAMARVGRNKDFLLQLARENRAEAIWFVDSDLICDPMTFTSLWSIPDQVVAACYWTRWTQPPPEHPPIHAGPQVWLTHPYGLQGNGLDEWEFRRRLVDRQITQVFGQGACTLIRREALLKGVSFAPWPGNQLQGIGQGEDRHFSMRAEALHIRQVTDPWPDIFHIYHRPDDEALIPEMLNRLSPRRVATDFGDVIAYHPKLGDLVSLELAALEPVPTTGGLAYPPTQLVRGRLGKMPLHIELEQAVLKMERGETRMVPAHFGLDYVFPPYRGQRRLMRLTLIDHKPMGFAPVIEDEIIRNDAGSWVDTTTLPEDTIEALREIHA